MATTTRQIRLGMCGLGVASTQVLPAMRGLEQVKVTAAADLRQEALDKFAREYGGETYSSIEALCKSPNVDGLWVSTPNHLHAECTIMAAEYKKNVIVEKPMAITVAECEAMVAAAKRNGVRLMQGHTKMQEAPIRMMGELVRSGEPGKLGMIQTWYQPFFGLTVVSCEKGDIRQSADGLIIYGDDGKREIPVDDRPRGRAADLMEMYHAVTEDREVFPDGQWGMATLEATVGIIESARQRKEIVLTRQTPVRV